MQLQTAHMYCMLIEEMLDIAVDEVCGYVYWGDTSKLKRAALDGSKQSIIHEIPGRQICVCFTCLVCLAYFVFSMFYMPCMSCICYVFHVLHVLNVLHLLCLPCLHILYLFQYRLQIL